MNGPFKPCYFWLIETSHLVRDSRELLAQLMGALVTRPLPWTTFDATLITFIPVKKRVASIRVNSSLIKPLPVSAELQTTGRD